MAKRGTYRRERSGASNLARRVPLSTARAQTLPARGNFPPPLERVEPTGAREKLILPRGRPFCRACWRCSNIVSSKHMTMVIELVQS